MNKYPDKKELKNFLKKNLKIKPRKLYLFELAFTHRSATIVDHNDNILNNERLEFLGDSVLDAIISDYLCKNYPNFDEGFLTKTRSKIVNTNQLAKYCQILGLDNYLVYSSTSLNNKHLYADLLEALIGAIFLDKGFKKTYKFVVNKIIENTNLERLIKTETNHKSRLIEYCQKKNISLKFNTKSKEDTGFYSDIVMDDEVKAHGEGQTKKEAEQNAALIVMRKIFPNYNKF